MNRATAEAELFDLLGAAMSALGKSPSVDGTNETIGPAIGQALELLGLPVESFLDPTDDEVLAVPAGSRVRFIRLASRELARRLHAAAVSKVRQQVGRDSEIHWQQLREGLESLIARLDSDLTSGVAGGKGAFSGGTLRVGESPPRAIHRDW